MRIFPFFILFLFCCAPISSEECTDTPTEKKEDNSASCDTGSTEKKDDSESGDKDKKEDDKDKKEDNSSDKKNGEACKKEPPKIGNFSLPGSQQPSTLVGFGGNIFDQGEFRYSTYSYNFFGRQKVESDIIPTLTFGVTSTLSFTFRFPFTPLFRDGCNRSSGLEDFSFVAEYAFYQRTCYSFTDQATILGGIYFPTGSIIKNPNTGFGSPSFFVGATYYHTTVSWVLFTNLGTLLTTSEHRTQLGNLFFYQFGAAKTFFTRCGWIYTAMLEVDGTYAQKNRIGGCFDPNSGGNVVYATPSIYIANKKWIFQFGVSFPVERNLFGKQRHFDYALNFNLARSFY